MSIEPVVAFPGNSLCIESEELVAYCSRMTNTDYQKGLDLLKVGFEKNEFRSRDIALAFLAYCSERLANVKDSEKEDFREYATLKFRDGSEMTIPVMTEEEERDLVY